MPSAEPIIKSTVLVRDLISLVIIYDNQRSSTNAYIQQSSTDAYRTCSFYFGRTYDQFPADIKQIN